MKNLFDLLKDNPTATAIIGGAPLAAAITYILKQLIWIPNVIYRFIIMNITSYVEVFENFEINKTTVDTFLRCNEYFINLNNKYIRNNIKLSASTDRTRVIGNGHYYITQLFKEYKVFVTLDLSKIPRDDIGGNAQHYLSSKSKLHQINIRVYGLNKNREKFIQDLNYNITNNHDDLTTDLDKYFPIVTLQQSIHVETIDFNFQFKRSFDSIYINKEHKYKIKEFLYNFINGKQIYDEANIVYKTGILLDGEPGTGKTSTIKAICSEFNLPMFIVEPHLDVKNIRQELGRLKHHLTFGSISTNLNVSANKILEQKYLDKPLVVVFEEIDKMFEAAPGWINGRYISQEEINATGTSANEVNLQAYLQFFDGINSPNNVIFVATTNYLDRIEPALIRKGRFDFVFPMNKINYELATEMIKDMCPHKKVSDFIQEGEEINSSNLFAELLHEQLK